jgi:hypothetical protein
MSVVEVKSAFKKYKSKLETVPVLNGLDMRVQKGQMLVEFKSNVGMCFNLDFF